ncbi:MAG: DNA alkylation repair protein, partial [Lachnospiraceae bacterium]|nr:DNA alkylation repair protein [Lachnospiraceae bacterium]
MLTEEIRTHLFELQDEGYRAFQAKLMPTMSVSDVIGVRTPALRKYAKELMKGKEVSEFFGDLPHEFFDENQLHAFLISEMKDFASCIGEVCRFLPYVDNWATCDQMSPKVFKKHKEELLPYIYEWIESDAVYTVRFAVGMLMEHFLDADFDVKYLK